MSNPETPIFSVIDIEQWNAAEWRGMGVVIYLNRPPILALLFNNEQPARKIFLDWKNRFGDVDKNEEIKIDIITKIDKSKPSSYITAIRPKVESKTREVKIETPMIFAARLHRMDPADSKNLDKFQEVYNEVKRYFIMPAILNQDQNKLTTIDELSILKSELNIIPAWKIGENDLNLVAMKFINDPIVPEGISDPPIYRALQRYKEKAGN